MDIVGRNENSTELVKILRPIHTRPEEFEQSSVILDLCFRKIQAGKSHDNCDESFSKKLRLHNVFRPHKNEKRRRNCLRFEDRVFGGSVDETLGRQRGSGD